jgi:cytochrome c-type biogenesis protein CcmH
VPLVAAVIYAQVGRYGSADVPREQRLAMAEQNNDWDALVARVEMHLDKNPSDVQGWQLLVSNYLNMGRFTDAANAMGRIIAVSGPTAELYASMGEALVFANSGLTNAMSIAATAEALKLDPAHPKARYYDALAMAQAGQKQGARDAFQKLLASAPADAPWRKAVEGQLALLQPNAAAPKISADQMQGAAAMAPDERQAMIRSMVDGLDEKLKTNPDDIEGWLRLIRARVVLGDGDRAATALATARTTFAAKSDHIKLLDELARELNLK